MSFTREMGCGCGKRNGAAAAAVPGKDTAELLSPTEWGPFLWKYLHCIAEKMGFTGNKIIDTDQATYMEILLNTLPLIIPCQECQAHTAAYIQANPVPTLRGLYGQELRQATRLWMFLFHQAVRTQKGQDILVLSVEDCAVLYHECAVPKCEYTSFIQSVSAAVRQGWVRIDQWRKWYSYSERLRIISGNIVV